jgi:AraC-like DNA-binding protein
MNEQKMDDPFAMTVYLGSQWVLVSSRPGDYQSSEALAPSFVSSTDPDFTIHGESETVLQHGSYLLRHSEISSARGLDLFYLYVDPLAPAGQAIQMGTHAAVDYCRAALPLAALQLIRSTVDLADGRLKVQEVQNGVDAILAALTDGFHVPSPDATVQEVANVAKKPGGLAYEWREIGLQLGISPDYLRQQFSRHSGISLSGYRSWLRFRLAIEYACDASNKRIPINLTEFALAAGYYDSAHCARFMRKNLGESLSSVGALQANYVDCR